MKSLQTSTRPHSAVHSLEKNRLCGFAAARRPSVVKCPKKRHIVTLVQNVAEFSFSSPLASSTENPTNEALLCAKISCHSASVAAIAVIEDTPDSKKIVTTSLDKSVALWSSDGSCCDVFDNNSHYTEAQRFSCPGGPVFSVLLDRRSDDGMLDQVYMGTHSKQVLAWVPPRAQLESGVVLEGHCGWVRALASSQGGRWLFSAACKEIRQWDMARAVPSAAGTTVVEKGDILAMVASKDTVFTAGSDGSIRSFSINKLAAGACRPKAHSDRVCALVLDKNILFSASYDGSIKAWDATTLEIIAAVENAHNGERVNCLAMGPGKLLYSGGADCMVRRWSPGLLQEADAALYAHNSSVSVLDCGKEGMVVSGDTSGEVAVWGIN